MGLMATCCFYCFVLFYVMKAYFFFRKTGGIKGLNPVTDLAEERVLRTADALSRKAGRHLE